MRRSVVQVVVLVTLIAGAAVDCRAQTSSELNTYFQQYAGLNQDQIAAIRKAEAVAKILDSRIPAEIFVVGVVYINAAPESYVKFAYDFDRLRTIPEYLAVEKFSNPPQFSDLKGFELDSDDIKGLKDCKPGHCDIQIPAGGMDKLDQAVNWSAADVDQQVNQLLQTGILQHLLTYQKEGDSALGKYNDKHNPTEVPEQFKYMLSYTKVLPKALPDFYNYLLDYPTAQPANVQNMFYWAKVKFGLKPTLRAVQVVTMQGNKAGEPAYTIAEKQLYSSHYFETALDLTYCIRSDDPQRPGFYLIMVMGSEQAGLTGIKGSMVRRVAVDRSVSSLQKSLMSIKTSLEQKP